MLKKLPLLQKVLYEQNAKKNDNSSLCQTKNKHLIYTNFKEHNTSSVNPDCL